MPDRRARVSPYVFLILGVAGILGLIAGTSRMHRFGPATLEAGDSISDYSWVIDRVVEEWGNLPIVAFVLSSSGCGPDLNVVNDAILALTDEVNSVAFLAIYIDSTQVAASRFGRRVDLSIPSSALARADDAAAVLARFGDSFLERQIVIIDPARERVALRMDLFDLDLKGSSRYELALRRLRSGLGSVREAR